MKSKRLDLLNKQYHTGDCSSRYDVWQTASILESRIQWILSAEYYFTRDVCLFFFLYWRGFSKSVQTSCAFHRLWEHSGPAAGDKPEWKLLALLVNQLLLLQHREHSESCNFMLSGVNKWLEHLRGRVMRKDTCLLPSALSVLSEREYVDRWQELRQGGK